jgi:hypothetical protein
MRSMARASSAAACAVRHSAAVAASRLREAWRSSASLVACRRGRAGRGGAGSKGRQTLLLTRVL